MDIGCGPGHLAAAIAATHPDADVVGIDLDPVQVRRARRHDDRPNLRYERGASHPLPFPDGSRDRVIATETYRHWSAPDPSLCEIPRVLRPRGSFWLVEGAGDMTKAEFEAWSGRKALPGLIHWVRLVFRAHGYTTQALQDQVLPRVRDSPFGGGEVEREDGWWVVRMVKQDT